MTLDKKYTIVRSAEDYAALCRHIDEYVCFAFDTETTGLNVRKDKVIGLSISGQTGTAFYLPLWTWEKKEGKLVQMCSEEGFRAVLNKLATKELLMWNGSFDCRIVRSNFAIDLVPALLADVMLMKHTVDEEGDFSLKGVAIQLQSELGLDIESAANEEQIRLKENVILNGGTWLKSNKEMFKADLEVMGEYACADADLTLRLAEYYRTKLEEEGLEEFFYDKEVMPLYRDVTITMEQKGVHLNLPLIEKTREAIIKDMSQLEQGILSDLLSTEAAQAWKREKALELYPPSIKGKFATKLLDLNSVPLVRTEKGAYSFTAKNIGLLPESPYKAFLQGTPAVPQEELESVSKTLFEELEPLNISSKKQLGEIVFDFMKIKPLSKTDKGAPQFNDDMIQALADDHKQDWAKKLSNYNKLSKLKGTYMDGYLEEHEEGIFYPSFFQHRTISGRYGSNLQQLPRPKEEGEQDPIVLKYTNVIREFFISGPGRSFVDDDYESLEPHCVSKHSKVGTINGIKEIKDVKIGELIFTSGGYKKITNKWDSSKITIELVTKKGVVRCSPDHKVYVEGVGWKRAEDLSVGDVLQEHKLVCQNNSAHTTLPVYLKESTKSFANMTVTDEVFWALGAFLGDGVFCTTSSKYVGICGLHEDGVTTRFAAALESIGASPKKYEDRRTGGMESYRCHDSWLVDIFKKTFNLADNRHKLLHIPEYVLNAPLSSRLNFFAGLIDTDGTYSSRKAELSISTKSAKLASDICTLGNTLGLDGRIGLAPKGNHRLYQVRFTAVSINKLIEFGFSDFVTCERKKPLKKAMIGKVESPKAELLLIIKSEESDMVDISVEDNHEFICDNIRVHNCFAHVSGDEGLRDIFRNGYDFYSTIAIKTEDLQGVSADKKAANYLGKINKPLRQAAKVYSLGIPYGQTPYALGKTLGIPTAEAEKKYDGYLKGFPGLAQWMKDSEEQAQHFGFVRSEAGRIRHLPKVKQLYRIHGDKLRDFQYVRRLESRHGKDTVKFWVMDYKNGINNAKNFQIQSLGASIVNQAAIAINRKFKEIGIDAWVSLQIHDQLVMSVPEDRAEECAKLVQEIMENNYKLSIKLKAPAAIGKNLKEAH